MVSLGIKKERNISVCCTSCKRWMQVEVERTRKKFPCVYCGKPISGKASVKWKV